MTNPKNISKEKFKAVKEEFELVITANEVTSTDDRFTMDDLNLGNNYKPLDTYFRNANGTAETRSKHKNDKKKTSNRTMPRLAFQLYGDSIKDLSNEDKEKFPICRYTPTTEFLCGIFPSEEKFREYKDTIEYLGYSYGEGKQFVIYCWNLFSNILFVKECLKRFGKEGDQFVLIYCEKETKETEQPENENKKEKFAESDEYRNPYSRSLRESKNIIFHGAPGTGKTYLAKEIAADIISNGCCDNLSKLTDDQKKQVEFVQFHPCYDYTDFVEGLRPKTYDDGSVGFELQDGIFKKFVTRAKKNFNEIKKAKKTSPTKSVAKPDKLKPYIFIIDEINRGEISKIFGELFFSIDPGYRGQTGEVSTQYANMQDNPGEKFYIPENVYIIGTMNNIDRSVDSFDFAMRRRFRFIEIKAEDTTVM